MRSVKIFAWISILICALNCLGADAPSVSSTEPATKPVVAVAVMPLPILPGEQPAGHVPLALPIGPLPAETDATVDGVRRLPLSSGWRFSFQKQDKWFPAVVPGDVHLDLLRNGLIADPFYGTNEKTLQWISQRPWKYQCDFDVPREMLGQRRVELVADGIDTEAGITLNGQAVGSVADMFLRYRFDVKKLLKEHGNTLVVQFPVGGQRVTLRKQSVEYGWDFSPDFVTSGIYRSIRIEAGPVRQIDFVGVQQVHENGKVTLKLSADQLIKSRLLFNGKQVASGGNELIVSDPKLWWPNGMGDHPLYDLYVESEDGSGGSWHRRIGLRTVQLSTPDEPNYAQAFTFVVNEKPIFAKGASVVPPHAFAGAETPQLDRDLVDSAADANMNMLRIWSGGVFLLDDFYDRCDERGIMVWQEYQFLIYKDSPAYRAALAPDCKYQTQRLQSHPCIALWCGNNEGELLHRLNVNSREKQFDLPRARGFMFITHRLMPNVLREVDPVVSWLPSSPHSPVDMLLPFDTNIAGDLHEWTVWGGNASPHEYEENHHPRFASEYGMQSLSSLDLMQKFCPPVDLKMDLQSPTLSLREKSGGADGNKRFAVYLDRSYRKPRDFASLVYLTQLNQAWCDSVGTRWWRRLMPHCMGSLIWQLNDIWPGTTWSILDFGGKWKPAMYQAKRDFSPALVMAFIPPDSIAKNYWWKDENRPVRITTVYDGSSDQPVTLKWSLCRVADGSVIRQDQKNIILHANESITQADLDFMAACQSAGDAGLYLRYSLESNGQTISEDAFWFTEPKNVALPKSNVAIVVSPLGPGKFKLEMQSTAFQYRYWFDLPGVAFRASDNGFNLYPGERRTVTIQTPEDLSTGQIQRTLQGMSLGDTY
jgi:beta-mannosidase